MLFCLDWHCQGLSCKILIGHICFPEPTRRRASSTPADLRPLVTLLEAKLLVFYVESQGPAEDLTLPFRDVRSPFHSDTPVPDRLMVTPPITEKSIVLSQKAPCSITLAKQRSATPNRPARIRCEDRVASGRRWSARATSHAAARQLRLCLATARFVGKCKTIASSVEQSRVQAYVTLS
jgi:hypothetical protein